MPTPDPSIYAVTSSPIGNHCVAGAGFDVIMPAAELLCQRQTTSGPGLKTTQDLQVIGTVGEGITFRASSVTAGNTTIGDHVVNVQGGVSLAGGNGVPVTNVGIRGDYVGRQGSMPSDVRPYIEVIGSTRQGGTTVTAGVCTDVNVPMVGKVEVCPGVQQNVDSGRTGARIGFSTTLGI